MENKEDNKKTINLIRKKYQLKKYFTSHI